MHSSNSTHVAVGQAINPRLAKQADLTDRHSAWQASTNAGNWLSARFMRCCQQPLGLILIVSAYLTLTQNHAFWAHIHSSLVELPTLRAWDIRLTVCVTHWALTALLLSLLGLHRLLKPVLILTLLLAPACGYYMDRYDTIIDPSMIHNVLETDIGESWETVSVDLFNRLLVWGLFPAWLIWRTPLKHPRLGRSFVHRGLLVLGLVALILAIVAPQFKILSFWGRENRDVRLFINPGYPIRSMFKVGAEALNSGTKHRHDIIGADAKLSATALADPITVVFVLGETARADHFAINGYARDTTPRLAQQTDLLNFPDTQSCGTYTGLSVPCLFSRFNRDDMNKKQASMQDNVLDVLQRAGVTVDWVENDGGCKGVCARVPTFNIEKYPNGHDCPMHGCPDDVLIDALEQRLRTETDATIASPRIIVLHQQGSHGPAYYRRAPKDFTVFTPVCDRDDLTSCTHEEIINAYDNTILMTDWVVGESIATLQRELGDQKLAVVYLSDHGESLGENGVYLHGLPYAIAPPEQTQVPMAIWLSPRLRDDFKPNCLENQQAKPQSHDGVFDLLLGLAGVSTAAYRVDQDPLASCR